MKPTRHFTAVLLLAAFAAAGCSKRGGVSGNEGAEAQPKPVATPAGSTMIPAGEEGFGPEVKPEPAGPVTFADGEAAYHAKKYTEAALIFERYITQRPRNPWGYYMLGLCAWKSGDPAKAEQAFAQALSIDPDHVKSLVNLSRVLIEQKRLDEAAEKLTRAADIDLESTEVLRLLARTHHARGQVEEAMAAYQRAIDANELDAWSMNNLGLLLLEAQRASEALPLLSRAVELRPDVPAFYNNLGMALEHTGRFTAAAAAYQGALSADPDYSKAKQNLARVEAIKTSGDEPLAPEQLAKDPAGNAVNPADGARASN